MTGLILKPDFPPYLFIFILIITSLSLVFPEFSVAEENSIDNEFNELLQGFDSPAENSPTDNMDEILQGFDDQSTIPIVDSEINDPDIKPQDFRQKKWDITTLFSLSSSYNYQKQAPLPGKSDYQNISRLKFKIQPELRYKFNNKWDGLVSANAFYDAIYRLKGRSNYTNDTLNHHESEFEFREVYLRGTFTENFDIKIGRQIVVWGKSDSVRVVDILNPLDFREPGMVDIEDLRLPVTMIKSDYYFSNWNLSTIIIPEIRFNKMPAYGSDFSFSDNPLPDKELPENITDSEFALALNGIFSGWDLSFYAASYYDDQAHLENASTPAPQLILKHSRLKMLGAATNIAMGNWLIKMEVAFINGLEFYRSQSTFNRTDFMAGIDYTGFTNTVFSIEAVNRHIIDYNPTLELAPDLTKENEGQIALRYNGNFLHEKLKLVALASILGTTLDSPGFYRGSAEYEIEEATSILAGLVIYTSGEHNLFNKIASNDRVFVEFRYTF